MVIRTHCPYQNMLTICKQLYRVIQCPLINNVKGINMLYINMLYFSLIFSYFTQHEEMLGLVTDSVSLEPTVSAIICEKTKPNFYIFFNNFYCFQYFLKKSWLDHTYGMAFS